MSSLLATAVCLTSALLPSLTLAQEPIPQAQSPIASPGATSSYSFVGDPHSTITVQWGEKPINSYSLYHDTAFDFQAAVANLQGNYNASDPRWTDYCTQVNRTGPDSCVHLRIVPQEPNTEIDRQLLLNVLTQIRGMAYDVPVAWTLEASFSFGPTGGQTIGVGFVHNGTAAEGLNFVVQSAPPLGKVAAAQNGTVHGLRS
ncbi:uncharacterized protein KY384_004682 [Bacidia gigantensis]|uniref:uncharacterized protein n=1 Tax=Bacidia gigantensis TaxID=2732470 RepID=UPI001D051BF8|nr:uncharacterized protein KY384_004682 [Bacidia gigantensis]KAG8530644.1 hypothetical protein KY384_004682 [Bacidia gigantensis]